MLIINILNIKQRVLHAVFLLTFIMLFVFGKQFERYSSSNSVVRVDSSKI